MSYNSLILLTVGISCPTIYPSVPISSLGRLWFWLRMKGLYVGRDKTPNFRSSVSLNLFNVIMTALTETHQVSDVVPSTHLPRYDVMSGNKIVGMAKLAIFNFHQTTLVCPVSGVQFLFLARSVNTLSPIIHNKNIA